MDSSYVHKRRRSAPSKKWSKMKWRTEELGTLLVTEQRRIYKYLKKGSLSYKNYCVREAYYNYKLTSLTNYSIPNVIAVK